ncbi:orotate phosphoribosyltransferase [Neobacillus notoginsengisoli]|uniref:Orotate phosphoribosyltransferase n=1 Tax=Neobacillus notoginsengisoli TaxID=1578198 RepID=A0A417YQH0_9BACI|nr:orotate phosphoribosyltransferase [Neobacillus notoginsengisoli]RHW36470.1 orotate phosphoribosyltransferase [Neobacillus notoginsengisoli]
MSKEIAAYLLEINAVTLRTNNPFTWTSGMKSPIYCDNRLTLSFPEIRTAIAIELTDRIKEYFSGVDVIAGTATAGIPHAAWVSEKMGLPLSYVRSSAKGHGKGNQIEGKVSPGRKVVIIEDLISTGGSVIAAANALKEAGAEVLGVAAIFTYGLEKGRKKLEEAGLHTVTITDFPELAQVAVEKEYIKQAELACLMEWYVNPEEWGKAKA